jgi:hypothetical protein
MEEDCGGGQGLTKGCRAKGRRRRRRRRRGKICDNFKYEMTITFPASYTYSSFYSTVYNLCTRMCNYEVTIPATIWKLILVSYF